MTVTAFLPHHAVEICGPKHGSGYRIGGRLVLTAAHLFEELGVCQVRSKGIPGREGFAKVDAIVVWIAEEVDVALVELPESIESCDPVQFGVLPDGLTGASIAFQFYGYPKWAATKTANSRHGSGGRQVNGQIVLADTSFEGLIPLRPEIALGPTDDRESSWEGASGAAIVCDGYVVAVQSQHQNPKMFTALEAAPLLKVYEYPEWRAFLEQHEISSTPTQIKLPKRRTKGKTGSKMDPVNSSRRSSKDNGADLFWELDYKRQERHFTDRLEELESCAAFSVVAPCEMTQQWLLNRLKKKIPNRQNAVMISPMNLRQHPMQGNFEEFWIDLAQQIGTQPKKEEILRSLCHSQVERPIILTIYGFRDFGPTQKKIIREFWEPLTGMMNQGSRRSGRSRVVLFLVDQCRPNYDSPSIVPLEPFDELLQKDVKIWFESDAVAKWCQKQKFGDRSGENWIDHEVPKDEWENPSLIFDRLCTKFQLGHDGMDIQDVWKWAS
jgi:inactive STAND/Trypsin